jgi:hypothetical protein
LSPSQSIDWAGRGRSESLKKLGSVGKAPWAGAGVGVAKTLIGWKVGPSGWSETVGEAETVAGAALGEGAADGLTIDSGATGDPAEPGGL